jgi:tetratricopeptide (TPR) repeat protein
VGEITKDPVEKAKPQWRDRTGRAYEPAVSPRLRVLLLAVIFPGVALLGATGAYLAAIRLMEWMRGQTYTNQVTLTAFLVHIVAGVLLVLPFVFFGLAHVRTAYRRKNRVAVRLGVALFVTSLVAGATGLALIQLAGMPQLPTGTPARLVVYGLHVIVPVAAVMLYVQHRRAGPRIQWGWGWAWGTAVTLFIGVMAALHAQDPRKWYARGSPEGEKYFEPSPARTVDGNFLSAQSMLMDDYCLKCHQDIYRDHIHSAHKFSSFNNPAYLFSVLETRRVGYQRDGHPRASRWCAGCHDPVPFFGGAFDEPVFDDPNFDVSKHPTAGAGITCTVCHAIVNINSPTGNADYTIEEPLHYPFAYSSNAVLQWLNQQVVKARPEFHKKTFLKPFHRTAEFCSTCHKVNLPMAVNHYKEFLRGQNHYDSFLLSGASGHGARSFYYPAEAKTRCALCHMPLHPSNDFGSRDFDGRGERTVHNHRFLAANTGVPFLLSLTASDENQAKALRAAVKVQADFLADTDPSTKPMRIDVFGLKECAGIDGRLIAPLRPELPSLVPGRTYLIEVVVRTLNMGHAFTEGTADSNEVWVDFQARSGGKLLAESGALDQPGEAGQVDPWSHFINVLMLDRNGQRIDRRNPQDIFTPLYNHQIGPGAAQVVHYKLSVPIDVEGPVTLAARPRYRKFDYRYMQYVHKDAPVPKLPITELAADEVTLPVAGTAERVGAQQSPIRPAWQRWNDYGIGCLLEGGAGSKKGELRQARDAFSKLLSLGDKEAEGHAYLNLARVANEEGRLDDAVEALNRASKTKPPAPWWTVAWFTGLVNAQNGNLDQAIASFEQILDPKNQPHDRGFDFSKDYIVINELAATLFKRAQQEVGDPAARDGWLARAAQEYERTLEIDPEDLAAHYGLAQCYARLAEDAPKAEAGKPDRLDGQTLIELADHVMIGSTEARSRAAAQLAQAVTALAGKLSDPEHPKLPVLQAIMSRLKPAAQSDSDLGVRMVAADVLARCHRLAHAILRPDENAQDRAVAIYRKAHPEANHAAEAIVIYDLKPPAERVSSR